MIDEADYIKTEEEQRIVIELISTAFILDKVTGPSDTIYKFISENATYLYGLSSGLITLKTKKTRRETITRSILYNDAYHFYDKPIPNNLLLAAKRILAHYYNVEKYSEANKKFFEELHKFQIQLARSIK